jgi:hypothetical protein
MDFYEQISREMSDDERKQAPLRSSFQQMILLITYIMRSIMKESRYWLMFLGYLWISIVYYISTKKRYILSHRDLHSHNILVKSKTIYIIDAEVSVLAEAETDIAIIARYYFKEIGLKNVILLIQSRLQTEKQKKNFIRLTIFFAIQILAREPENDKYYQEALEYLCLLHHDVIPNIQTSIHTKSQQTVIKTQTT